MSSLSDIHDYFVSWGINSGVLDNYGMTERDILYDPRFDENDSVINIYNVYAYDKTYINDDNFNDDKKLYFFG